MYPSNIPSECDPRILVWANQGVAYGQIVESLAAEGVVTSPGAVGRRVRALRAGATSLTLLEQDVWKSLELNLTDFDEAEGRLRDIEELALDGDEARGIRPSLSIAHRAVVRRIELLLNKHKFLQSAIDQGLRRRRDAPPAGEAPRPANGATVRSLAVGPPPAASAARAAPDASSPPGSLRDHLAGHLADHLADHLAGADAAGVTDRPGAAGPDGGGRPMEPETDAEAASLGPDVSGQAEHLTPLPRALSWKERAPFQNESPSGSQPGHSSGISRSQQELRSETEPSPSRRGRAAAG